MTLKPFPYDKISESVIKTILESDEETWYLGPANDPEEDSVGTYGPLRYAFATKLLDTGMALPDSLITAFAKSKKDTYLGSNQDFGRDIVLLLELSMHYEDQPFDNGIINYLLDYVIDNIDTLVLPSDKYDDKMPDSYGAISYLFMALTWDKSSPPFPEKFVDFCRNHFEIAYWLVKFDNSDQNVKTLKVDIDYDNRLTQHLAEKEVQENEMF